MTADELIALANDPRFIKGIQEYCDDWCKRCAFTERCFRFAQKRLLAAESGFEPTDSEDDEKTVTRAMQNAFELAAEMSERGAVEDDIALASPEGQAAAAAWDDDQEKRYDTARAHPLTQAAEEYAFAAYAWFEQNGAELEMRIQRAQQSEELHADHLSAKSTEDAIEIIRWDQFRPVFTLVAIFGGEDRDGRLADTRNGKVKSILLGLDRSLLAWGRVQMFWPAQAHEIMHLAGLLAELRLWLERAFPAARDFVRPGFDDASTLLP